jgi:hypothetical protein
MGLLLLCLCGFFLLYFEHMHYYKGAAVDATTASESKEHIYCVPEPSSPSASKVL